MVIALHRRGANCSFLLFLSPYLSLSTTFPLEKRSIKRSTTFISERNLYPTPPTFISMSHVLSSSVLFLCVMHFAAFFGMNRMFDLSVLVEFQSHARLCSEQLQLFPVYLSACNLRHFRACKIHHIFLCACSGRQHLF